MTDPRKRATTAMLAARSQVHSIHQSRSAPSGATLATSPEPAEAAAASEPADPRRRRTKRTAAPAAAPAADSTSAADADASIASTSRPAQATEPAASAEEDAEAAAMHPLDLRLGHPSLRSKQDAFAMKTLTCVLFEKTIDCSAAFLKPDGTGSADKIIRLLGVRACASFVHRHLA
jgi:hypothetical protein